MIPNEMAQKESYILNKTNIKPFNLSRFDNQADFVIIFRKILNNLNSQEKNEVIESIENLRRLVNKKDFEKFKLVFSLARKSINKLIFNSDLDISLNTIQFINELYKYDDFDYIHQGYEEDNFLSWNIEIMNSVLQLASSKKLFFNADQIEMSKIALENLSLNSFHSEIINKLLEYFFNNFNSFNMDLEVMQELCFDFLDKNINKFDEQQFLTCFDFEKFFIGLVNISKINEYCTKRIKELYFLIEKKLGGKDDLYHFLLDNNNIESDVYDDLLKIVYNEKI